MKNTFFSKFCLVCLLIVSVQFISHHAYAFDLDSDGYEDDVDCDDLDPEIHPGVVEVCDGVDNNCVGGIDDGVTTTYYHDADDDAYGDATDSEDACAAPADHVTNALDCDDTDAEINPDATEVCDDVDNNCDAAIDNGDDTLTWYMDNDGDTYGDSTQSVSLCEAPEGYVSNSSDCDDTTTTTGAATAWYADADGDTYGDLATTQTACTQPAGYVTDSTDTDDADASVYPGAPDNGESGDDEDGDGAAAAASSGCSLSLASSGPQMGSLFGFFFVFFFIRIKSFYCFFWHE